MLLDKSFDEESGAVIGELRVLYDRVSLLHSVVPVAEDIKAEELFIQPLEADQLRALRTSYEVQFQVGLEHHMERLLELRVRLCQGLHLEEAVVHLEVIVVLIGHLSDFVDGRQVVDFISQGKSIEFIPLFGESLDLVDLSDLWHRSKLLGQDGHQFPTHNQLATVLLGQ